MASEEKATLEKIGDKIRFYQKILTTKKAGKFKDWRPDLSEDECSALILTWKKKYVESALLSSDTEIDKEAILEAVGHPDPIKPEILYTSGDLSKRLKLYGESEGSVLYIKESVEAHPFGPYYEVDLVSDGELIGRTTNVTGWDEIEVVINAFQYAPKVFPNPMEILEGNTRMVRIMSEAKKPKPEKTKWGVKVEMIRYTSSQARAARRLGLTYGDTIQARTHTDVGGYPILYLDRQSSVICPECAAELESDGERMSASFIHWEGEPAFCEECSMEVESAYGPTD